MSENIVFISGGRLNTVKNGEAVTLQSQALQRYEKNLRDIKERKEWKSSTTDAGLRGIPDFLLAMEDNSIKSQVTGAVTCEGNKLIYAAVFEGTSGLYMKDLLDDNEVEGHIISKNDLRIYDIDFESVSGNIVASVNHGNIQRNLMVSNVSGSDYHFVTEGDCLDCNPVFSKTNPDVIYYDSCGIAFDNRGNAAGFGARAIMKLNIKTGDLDEIIADDKIEYLLPRTDWGGICTI